MKHITIFTAALLALAVYGCASVKPPEDAPRSAGIGAADDVQLGDRLLEALRARDYDAFAELWGSRDKKMTPEDFKNSYETIEKQFGTMRSFSYLTELKTPLVRNRIWTVRFERRTDQGRETVEQDLLFRLVTGDVDGRLRILGMGFL